MLGYLIMGTFGLLVVLIIAYVIINKALNKGDRKYLRELRKGTQTSGMSSEVIYQKLYMMYLKIPGLKGYLAKLRRRLEIITIEDEYQTRRQSAAIITRMLLIVFPLTIGIILLTKSNVLLMLILLIFEVFMVDTFIDGMVGKLDTKLLKQQVEFFSEIRHAYHVQYG